MGQTYQIALTKNRYAKIPINIHVLHPFFDTINSPNLNCTRHLSIQMNHVSQPKDAISSASMPFPGEESICSFKSPVFTRDDGTEFRVSGGASASASKSIASGSKADRTQISSSSPQRQNSSGFDPPAQGHSVSSDTKTKKN